jgi:hypothetical protein
MLVGLEMDAERMSFWSFETLPPWAMALSLAAHLTAGTALGAAYFYALRQNARLFASGHRRLHARAALQRRSARLRGRE